MRAKYIEAAKKELDKDKCKSESKATTEAPSTPQSNDLPRGSVTIVEPDRAPSPTAPPVPPPCTDLVPCVSKDAFTTGDVIGQGTFAMVLQGVFNGRPVAIKMLVNQDTDPRSIMEFEHEVSIMAPLRHPHVCRLLAVCRDVGRVSMLFPLLELGTLWDVLRMPGPLPMPQRLQFILELALGMEYLHSCRPRIVHRDLKSPNVLVAADFHVQVADFGLSCRMERHTLHDLAGTPNWMAPEVFTGRPYTEKVDVFSFGTVVWEILTGQPPLPDIGFEELKRSVVHQHLRPSIPSGCPLFLETLMTQCWHPQPSQRPSFTQIVQECTRTLAPSALLSAVEPRPSEPCAF